MRTYKSISSVLGAGEKCQTIKKPKSSAGNLSVATTKALGPYYDHFSVAIRGREVECNRRFALDWSFWLQKVI